MGWINLKDAQPTVNKDYLVVTHVNINGKNHYIYDVCHWANNLRRDVPYDFDDDDYERSGFYDYDGEAGYYEKIRVDAWQEIEEYEE